MNVNSDDDAQTRATSSTAIAWARIPPPCPPYSSGNARPAKPASRHASQLAHGYSSCSSASAALGAMCSSASRRNDARSSTYSSERTNALTPSGRSAALCRRAWPETRCSRSWERHSSTRSSSSAIRSGRNDLRGRRRRARGGGCSCAPRRARAATRSSTNCIVGQAVVAEQRDRDVDVAHHRRPPEVRGALAGDLGDHRDHVVGVLDAARSGAGRAPGPRACRRSRRSAPDARAAHPRRARRPGRRDDRPASRAPGGGDRPGGRFCCWRGRSASSDGTNGSVGIAREVSRLLAPRRRPGAGRSGSSRAGPATRPR